MYYTKSQIGKDIEMSGPKTSRYVLTEEQKRILEEQQRKNVLFVWLKLSPYWNL